MALDARSRVAARFHWLWLVLQILDVLFFHMANAAAAYLLFGGYLKGELACYYWLRMSTYVLRSQSLLLQDPVTSRKLNHWADDLSCALFGLANVVTAMYYLIDATNGKDALVEGGQIQRPAWLGFSVHVFNSLVAWADILCAHPRSFSKSSGRLSVGIVAFYTIWILTCSHFNGAFPYPILNELPWPTVRIWLLMCCSVEQVPTRYTDYFTQCTSKRTLHNVHPKEAALAVAVVSFYHMSMYAAVVYCFWRSGAGYPC